MKLHIFIRVLAIYTIALFGFVWLLYPQAGLGNHADATSLLIARSLGTNMVIIGLIDWMVSFQEFELQRRFLSLNILVHTVPLAIITTNILTGTFDSSKWSGAILHVLPLIGCLYYVIKRFPVKPLEA
jgi:hypothetical protein